MRQCAFLTMDNTAGFVFDDDLAVAPLRSLGWEVSFVSWTDPAAPWDRYEICIPRATWDYHHHLVQFLSVLETIEKSNAFLANSLSLIRWNARKTYLLDLSQRGIRIVPTVLGHSLNEASLSTLRTRLGADNIIVKPLVSANADFTFPLRPNGPQAVYDEAFASFGKQGFLAQRFIDSVVSEGEFSLFYFNGKYSHAILKTPKRGDFRVQEEHGGIIKAFEPGKALHQAGQKALDSLTEVPLYARADFVHDEEGELCLMEIELIEPALYFRMDPHSPTRFAEAVDEWMRDGRQT